MARGEGARRGGPASLSGFALLTALVMVPLAAAAQSPPKAPRIGLLATNPSVRLEAFARGLRELGWVEGQNIEVVRRIADGKTERLPALATELVRLNVSVIVAPDPPSALAAKNATSTIPIVMRASDDPVATGLVASFARPGGNITGVYSLYAELGPKRLEILREAVPGITLVGVLWNPAFGGAARVREFERAARALGLRLESLEVRRPDDFEGAFRAARAARVGAVITVRSPIIVVEKARIVDLARLHRVPVMYDERDFVEAGGLMAYGANLEDLYRRTATYVDKILKGAKPSELPVEQATKFELVVNLKAAAALGLTLPRSFLLRADHVIR